MHYKEYVIPKKGGKTRKIVAPDDELKAFQQGNLKRLENIFYTEVTKYKLQDQDIFHGFLHGKNCVTAAKKHIGFNYTVMMDIAHFFDSVFANHIDPKYQLDSKLFHHEGHAAQGFPSSPLVANIASVPVLAAIHERLFALFREKFAITIYADDVAISCNDELLSPTIQRIVTEEFNMSGFIINQKKTRVRYAKHGYRRILGINVGITDIRATRKTMRKIRAAKHQAKRGSVHAGRSAGGLVTWSKCIPPGGLRLDLKTKRNKH
jgi:hypothetical protein